MGRALKLPKWGLLLLAVLSACQPLPQPFHPDRAEVNDLLAPKGAGGLAVRPPSGIAPPVADAIARSLVEYLEQKDIPATLGDQTVISDALYGDALVTPAPGVRGGESGALDIFWVLTDPRGGVVRHFQVSAPLTPPRQTLSPTALAEITRRTIEPLLPILTQESGAGFGASDRRDARSLTAFPPDTAPAKPRHKIKVPPVEGAPGDGAAALKRAMEAVLRDRGIPTAKNGDTVVRGLVSVTPVTAAQPKPGAAKPLKNFEKITVSWSVIDSKGVTLGTVTQSNVIPAGSLNQRWGNSAFDVALAAWQELDTLLELAGLDLRSAPVSP